MILCRQFEGSITRGFDKPTLITLTLTLTLRLTLSLTPKPNLTLTLNPKPNRRIVELSNY